MKTPRQILFERHEQIEGKLDAIRERCVESLDRRRDAEGAFEAGAEQRRGAGGWIASLRWHFAALGATWLVILLLRLGEPGGTGVVTTDSLPTAPAQLALALRENRRQLVELTESPIAAPLPGPVDRRRRSAIETFCPVA